MSEQIQAAKRAMSEAQAACYICMSRSFLRQARMTGDRPLTKRTPGPRYVRIGRRIRYLIDDLDQWLLDHVVEREVPGHE